MPRYSMELLVKRNARLSFWLVIVLVILLLISAQKANGPLSTLIENTLFIINPTAERAFEYGSRHFDAQKPKLYDVEKARRYFERALAMDSTYPNVQHQLARIAFLRGDFELALARINLELENNPNPVPSSFYVRGLVEGYMGRYNDAARDYELYLSLLTTKNWAGITDYAWVLLKAGRHTEAARVTDDALSTFPDNPWLLNANAIAHFEIGEYERALISIRKASESVKKVSENEWHTAYPGNDPKIASTGLATFKTAVENNMHMIETKAASSTVQ